MRGLIHYLHSILTVLKGFEAGYTTSNNSQMIISNGGKVYKLTLEEVGEGQVDDYMNQL
jgi:hypothetical protein